MKIKLGDEWQATSVEVNRLNDGRYNATIKLVSERSTILLHCKGASEADSLLEIFGADYVAVEETQNAQLEFGRFVLSFYNEGYCEVEFNEIIKSDI